MVELMLKKNYLNFNYILNVHNYLKYADIKNCIM